VLLKKSQNHFAAWEDQIQPTGMATAVVPLEDELGDVLEKGMRGKGLSIEQLAAAAEVSEGKIADAIDYRSELTLAEVRKLAEILGLNEVGMCALSQGSYPLPILPGLPFCLEVLHMNYGVGVANAYLLSEVGSSRGILFDTGSSLRALLEKWPSRISHVDAVFLTHIEGEHTGGLCDVVDYFGIPAAYVPEGCQAPCGSPLGEPTVTVCGTLEVTAYCTPGHASAHNCYRVRSGSGQSRTEVLIAGDLIFAGSAGGAYFCCRQHQEQLRRILKMCPPSTVIAPGHGPLSTVENELKFNPFAS